ncbi:MAG: hypothetical protein ACYDHN_09165 [Solirubrobacteraceae bacterium]
MSQLIGSRHRSAALTALGASVACLTLLACGSSSSSPGSSNAAVTSTGRSTSTAPGGPAVGKRFTALRECLKKNGITLPKRTPGQRPGSGGFLAGSGGPPLPKGVTRAQYEAAIKKCGGGAGGRLAGGGSPQRFNTPAFKKALTKFASCMRENGVPVPAPNTSGKGPVFSTKGLNSTSAKFKAAQTKCAAVLRGVFRAQPGAAGAPPGGAG